MKKKIIYIIIFFFFVIFVLFGLNYKQYIPEIPSRLALYHNTGNITVVTDGRKLDLSGIDLDYVYETGEVIETAVLNDGKFKFKKGLYGPNSFSFKIPDDTIGMVEIEFGQFNTNWWHVCHYNVEIEMISQDDGTVFVKMKKELNIGNNDLSDVEETNKIITSEDNKITTEK